jgi:hypothetical protein
MNPEAINAAIDAIGKALEELKAAVGPGPAETESPLNTPPAPGGGNSLPAFLGK